MIFPPWLPVYGDPAFRGDCPTEDAEHVTVVNAVRRAYPKAAAVMIHPKNEGKRTSSQAQWDKARGLTKGISDFVFPGSPSLVLELKRKDHTKSKWQAGQMDYLQSAFARGSMIGVALGWEAALEAIKEWQTLVR